PRQQVWWSLETCVYKKTVLMRVSQNRFVDAVTAFLLPIDDVESERGFRYAIDFAKEVPALVMEESFAIRYQELQITNLRRVDGWVINLRHAAVVERVPDVARGRIRRSDCELCTARPPGFNPRTPWSKSRISHNLPTSQPTAVACGSIYRVYPLHAALRCGRHCFHARRSPMFPSGGPVGSGGHDPRFEPGVHRRHRCECRASGHSSGSQCDSRGCAVGYRSVCALARCVAVGWRIVGRHLWSQTNLHGRS